MVYQKATLKQTFRTTYLNSKWLSVEKNLYLNKMLREWYRWELNLGATRGQDINRMAPAKIYLKHS